MPINLGNPVEITVRELGEEVARTCGATEDAILWGPLFEYKDLPVDDPTRRCPDITAAKKLLGWEPRIKLREGLEKTAQYMYKAMNQ